MVSDAGINAGFADEAAVLILVIMEYGLGRLLASSRRLWLRCLNPCYNGIWSRTCCSLNEIQRHYVLILVIMEYGLGQRLMVQANSSAFVLILVIMEYGLGPTSYKDDKTLAIIVLILVIMEYGLGPAKAAETPTERAS